MPATTTYVIGTAAVVVAGRIAQDKPVDIKIAVGAGAYAIGLSLLNNGSPEIASRIALLVLVVTLFRYVPDIAEKTGLAG